MYVEILTCGFDLRPLSEAVLYRPLSLGAGFLSVVRISEVNFYGKVIRGHVVCPSELFITCG